MNQSQPIKDLSINVVNIIWSFDPESEKVLVLLVQSSLEPNIGRWGLPATRLRSDESADDASLRLIREKIGLDLPNFYTEQLATFSNINRSNKGRNIALTYMTYLPSAPKLTAGYGAKQAEWFSVGHLKQQYTLNYGNLTFKTLEDEIYEDEFYQQLPQADQEENLISDYSLILRQAFRRITNRLDYLPTILLILGQNFTLKQARIVYAAFLKESVANIDNSNFRKTHVHLFQEVGVRHGKSGRPAKLYRLK